MNRPGVLRILFLSLILILFGCSTEFAFAGVHGGGGGGFHGGGGSGFHAGGGYGGWHGGGYGGWHGGVYGGWHGGGYGGWHGGYGGWHGGSGGWYGWGGYYGGWGGGWGWGWPWGFGISFNFGWPYWGYYGYPYAYAYPNYYPYYPYSNYYAPSGDPRGYSDPPPPSQASGNGAPLRQPAPPPNTLTLQETVSRHPAANYGTASSPAGGVSYRPASAERQLPPMRPEVQNVIRALRAMPPEARQEQIDSGRYSNLTPQELKLVREAANLPSGNF